MELDPARLPSRDNPDNWEEIRKIFRQVFASKTRQEWAQIFDEKDACVGMFAFISPLYLHLI